MKVKIVNFGFFEGTPEEIIKSWKEKMNVNFSSKNLDEFMREMLRFFIYSQYIHRIVDKAFLENRKLNKKEKNELDKVLNKVDKEVDLIKNLTAESFINLLEKLGICHILKK